MLTNAVIFCLVTLIGCVLTTQSNCPSDQCRCETGTAGRGRIINCRARGINEIPVFQPSDEVFYELTLANPIGCSNCNNITVVPANAFQGLKVKVLDLRQNKVGHVSPFAFSNLAQHLEELLLEGNEHYPPPYTAISVLTNLKSLTLDSFNQLYMDATNADFRNLNNLQELTLKNMKITHIRENVFFQRLQKLKTLRLESLPLGILPSSSLKHLKTLRELRAFDIDIREIPYGAFSNFTSLKDLDLSHNDISSMKPGCFDGIEDSLEYLGLHLNKLNEVNVGPLAAARWSNLRQLNLGHNYITSIPSGLFFNMRKLEYLNLDSNKIRLIEPGTFQGLRSLENLDISYNRLSSLSSGAFLHTPNLTKLDIRGEDTNAFNISREGIKGLENKLEVLIVTDTVVHEDDMWKAVASLRRLQDLELGGTQISRIPDFQFVNNRQLVTLMLDRNRISSLSQRTFYGLGSTLKTLNLQGNAIQTINKCVLENLSYLEMLYLGKNPLNCDCRLISLRNWIVSRIRKNVIFQYMVDALCQAPPSVRYNDLWRIEENQLTCESNYVTPKCEVLPEVIPTTENPTTNAVPGDEPAKEQAPFRFTKIIETENTIELNWEFQDERMVAGSTVEYQLLGQSSASKIIDLSVSLQNYVIRGLQPDSNYLICLSVRPRNLKLMTLSARQICLAVKTLA